MSTAEFGDLNLGQAPAPAPEALTPLTLTPPAPVEPQGQPAVAPPVEAQSAPIPVSDMREVPLGTLIFREGLLTEEQLEEALQDGMQRGKRLGEVLLERGLVSENDLGRLLAGQKGLQFVQLDAATIDPAAVQLLSVEKARLHTVLPIGFQEGLPVVAVADPSNDLVIENVRRALNCEPRLVVAGREALNQQIELAYAAAAPVVAEPASPAVVAEQVPAVRCPSRRRACRRRACRRRARGSRAARSAGARRPAPAGEWRGSLARSSRAGRRGARGSAGAGRSARSGCSA